VPNVVESGNALVVRTLSKAFGLAGLRVGYAVGAPPLVAEVEKARGPYKVNAMAEEVAAVALTTDLPWVKEHVALAVENRDRLTDALRAMALSPITSSANFVLVPTPTPATEIASKMRAAGVAVRPFNSLPVVGDSLRISVGPWDMMQTTLRVLEGALR
jgi:histidinol-phosphate/aromatic aminotransferase/cobyric acid decarboxylase-like protein